MTDARPDIVPADIEALSAALTAARAEGRKLRVTGGGTRRSVPGAGDGVLRCDGLAGIRQFDAAEGVVEVGAGTRLDALEAKVSDAGWHVPLEGVAPGGTVGGALASGALGLRTVRHRTPRDHVLGLRIVDGTGQVSKCGGRVVKNVTGYDLAKLYVGSHGRLGVIESAWLHLQPRPRTRIQRVVALRRDPFVIGLQAARRPSISAAWLTAPGIGRGLEAGTWHLHATFEGEEAVCGADAEWLAAQAPGGAETASDTVDAELIEHALVRPAADRLSVRLHVLPTRLHALAMRSIDLGAQVVAAPVPGCVVATWRGEASNPRTLADISEAVSRLDGAAFLLSGPPDAAPKGAFAPSPGAAALITALRDKFDPAGILGAGATGARG